MSKKVRTKVDEKRYSLHVQEPMAGHNKWSKIKRLKSVNDAKKGKIYTKLNREITVAVKNGGSDPEGNPRLRAALIMARNENMPKDNIERAIKKAAGELGNIIYEEASFEGYGPSGAAVIIDVLTDNRNRVVPEIRHALSKHGGNLGENGSVSWNFETKGYLAVSKDTANEDQLMEWSLEAGAEDMKSEDDVFEILTDPSDFADVKTRLEEKGITFVSAQISKLPKTMVELQGADAEKMIKIIDTLEDNDDVQNVWTNANIPDEIMNKHS
ncbi:MAG: YebC/PmpR family DNA-binding transcriptional regulator [Bdellovibrionales bacterium]|nr:YebC/PmpR family DNA-binding transcriptional regulator [Bdellovibrionales bacterium]